MASDKRHRFSKTKRQYVLRRDNYQCQYCKAPADSVDHIIPWYISHDDSVHNVVACCKKCNSIANVQVFNSFKDKKKYILTQRKIQRTDKKKFVECEAVMWCKTNGVCFLSQTYTIGSAERPPVPCWQGRHR
jgi:hypothetical protein